MMQRSPPPPPPPPPLRLRAKWSFEGKLPGELRLSAGDVVQVSERAIDVNWFSGVSADGRSGRFPASYCEVLESSSPARERDNACAEIAALNAAATFEDDPTPTVAPATYSDPAPTQQPPATQQEQLLAAVLAPDVKSVRALLDSGADPQRTGPDGRTPLHLACECGSIEVARLLLRRGARIDVRDQSKRTAFECLTVSADASARAALFGDGSALDTLRREAADARDARVQDLVTRLLGHGECCDDGRVSAAASASGEGRTKCFREIRIAMGALVAKGWCSWADLFAALDTAVRSGGPRPECSADVGAFLKPLAEHPLWQCDGDEKEDNTTASLLRDLAKRYSTGASGSDADAVASEDCALPEEQEAQRVCEPIPRAPSLSSSTVLDGRRISVEDDPLLPRRIAMRHERFRLVMWAGFELGLAQQLTLFFHTDFVQLHMGMFALPSRKEREAHRAYAIMRKQVNGFNELVRMLLTDLLMEDDPEDRATVLSVLVGLRTHAEQLNNFQLVAALRAVFASPAFVRLKATRRLFERRFKDRAAELWALERDAESEALAESIIRSEANRKRTDGSGGRTLDRVSEVVVVQDSTMARPNNLLASFSLKRRFTNSAASPPTTSRTVLSQRSHHLRSRSDPRALSEAISLDQASTGVSELTRHATTSNAPASPNDMVPTSSGIVSKTSTTLRSEPSSSSCCVDASIAESVGSPLPLRLRQRRVASQGSPCLPHLAPLMRDAERINITFASRGGVTRNGLANINWEWCAAMDSVLGPFERCFEASYNCPSDLGPGFLADKDAQRLLGSSLAYAAELADALGARVDTILIARANLLEPSSSMSTGGGSGVNSGGGSASSARSSRKSSRWGENKQIPSQASASPHLSSTLSFRSLVHLYASEADAKGRLFALCDQLCVDVKRKQVADLEAFVAAFGDEVATTRASVSACGKALVFLRKFVSEMLSEYAREFEVLKQHTSNACTSPSTPHHSASAVRPAWIAYQTVERHLFSRIGRQLFVNACQEHHDQDLECRQRCAALVALGHVQVAACLGLVKNAQEFCDDACASFPRIEDWCEGSLCMLKLIDDEAALPTRKLYALRLALEFVAKCGVGSMDAEHPCSRASEGADPFTCIDGRDRLCRRLALVVVFARFRHPYTTVSFLARMCESIKMCDGGDRLGDVLLLKEALDLTLPLSTHSASVDSDSSPSRQSYSRGK